MNAAPKLLLGVVLARCPRSLAGHTCAVMNWALSFRALGWDVWITEHIDGKEIEAPEAPGQASPQVEFWREMVREFGFEGRECLLVNGKSSALEAMQEFVSGADLFLNYSGQFKRLDLVPPNIPKAYLDVDPAFTQIWVEVHGSDMNFAGHDLFFTVGTTMNLPAARIPKVGQEWIPIIAPVVAAQWRERLGALPPPDPHAAWTTIAHWYGYPDLHWEGIRYAGKRESLLAMKDLPGLVDGPCAIATDLKADWHDHDPFVAAGWQFLSSQKICHDVSSYLRFIAASRGEIGIAKEGYIVSRGGWMSDRSLIYLAFGRPVLLHDTGWPAAVTPGPGLLPFTNPTDCAAAMRQVESDYDRHSAGALHLAATIHSPAQALRPILERLA